MKFNPLPSLDKLDSIFSLDVVTGQLSWKIKKKGIREGKPVGSFHARGYLRVKIDGVEYFGHRIIYKMFYGEDPENFEIDHIDENTRNNAPSNLRKATSSDNSRNVSLTKRNTSGIKGVSFNRFRNNWRAFLSINGKYKNLGSFSTKDEAGEVIQQARKTHHKEFTNHG